LLRALEWIDVGSDLIGQGLLLMPVIGLVAIGRGVLVAILALLFVAFASGAFLQRSWTRWLGICLAIVNLLMVGSVVAHGDSPLRALGWSIVPLVMLFYLFSQVGRQSLKADSIY
jgi:hypothetical protein